MKILRFPMNRVSKNNMQVVILAGGLGTRLAEETHARPKPMVEIGGMPIIWHIMKIYEQYGFTDFVICCGYKGYLIKEFFANYFLHATDIKVDLSKNSITPLNQGSESWTVTLVDTGDDTMTGGRLLRAAPYLNGDTFLMTYGDGVADVDIGKLIEKHNNQKRLATLTAVTPPGRFGALTLSGDHNFVEQFVEKPEGDGALINGGFFVLNKDVLGYIDGDSSVWEQEPLRGLAQAGQLTSYVHRGFWHPMDTLRDKQYLEGLIYKKTAPWMK